ncbi:Hypothetical predicted protein [Mytilus galloprovincialis]|uniref:Integrase zinc-binding domain-containing protein n=1 Tax=Mytilus galloprovincialis TaxID=29158 RepID=A0A8B6FKW7_MYTGA|nr:Hypothetical predicted protein [Mytilus galloprovincialis]
MEKMYQSGIQNLSIKEADEFKRVLLQNCCVFADPDGETGHTLLGKHEIKLEKEIPIKEPPRRVPLFKRKILEEEIEKLEKKGIIEKSCSPWTDHGSLTWLYRFREPDGQISRWIQQISAYDFKIVHRPGKKHSNADALSRIKIKEQDFCTQCKLPWDYEFEAPPKQDETEEPVVIAPVNKINTEVDNSLNVPIKRGRKPNTPKRAQAKKQPDITLTPSLIHEMQTQDTELGDVLKLKLDSADKPTFENFTSKSTLFKNWIQKWELLTVQDDILCYYWEDQTGTKRWKICTPKALQGYVLWHLHDSPTGGHQGINRTKKRAALCPFFLATYESKYSRLRYNL